MRKTRIGWLVLTAVLLVGGAFLYGQEAARRLIERGASAALGADVSVSSVRLGLVGSDVSLGGIRVDDPAGFDQSRFLEVDAVDLNVRLPALLRREVVLPDVRIRGVEMNLVRRGDRTNYDQILERLRRPPAEDRGHVADQSSVDFRIGRIVIDDIDARARLLPEVEAVPDVAQATGLDDIQVHVPKLVLRNVTSAGSLTTVVSRVTNVIVVAVVETVARRATHLPANMAGDLADTGGDLGGASLEVVGQITQEGGEALGATLSSALGKEAGAASEVVTRDAGEALRALGGLVDRETHEDGR